MAGHILLHTTIACLVSTLAQTAPTSVVDLGYAVHKASVVEAPVSSHVYLDFSNIRYAAPPLDSLRFTAPELPPNNRSAGIQDGSYGNICPQAFPGWIGTALEVNNVSYYNGIGKGQSESEDCLFLDVIVSQKAFKDRRKHLKPVLIWLYGGGWVSGDKNSLTEPIGLLEAAEQDVVFVAPNYRLGAFGWLAGPEFREQGGTPNVGLLDQKLAFEWVQKHVHLFGGDPSRVTIMGESAGAGSILYHLVAPETSCLFDQILPQSPVILPHIAPKALDGTYKRFLKALNVQTLVEARALSSKELMRANEEVIAPAFYGDYPFGPSVDGPYVTDLPNRVLANDPSNKTCFVGHNANEGQLFVDPNIKTDAAFNKYLSNELFAHMPRRALDHVIHVLYPPKYDGSKHYKNVQERLGLLISEAFIGCSAHSVAQHTKDSWGYIFDIPPALHGEDIAYSFFTPGAKSPDVEYKSTAKGMQRYLASFVKAGNPNSDDLRPAVPEYHGKEKVLDIKIGGFLIRKDDVANERCAWWENILRD